MLWEVSILKGYAVAGSDGAAGTIIDLLFDDTNWKMQWLIANTRYWFPNHEVLLPVEAFGFLNPAQRKFSVRMTIRQIQDCPTADTARPVSRQTEVEPHRHCDRDLTRPSSGAGNPHLRSVEAVLGHRVHVADGEIGYVDDLLVDDIDWCIRYVRIDTWNWRPGHRMLVPSGIVRAIDWPRRRIYLDADRRGLDCELHGEGGDTAGETHDDAGPTRRRVRWVKA